MASERRIEKIENLLREMTAEIIARDFAFPEGTLVTVTRTSVSEDLFHATIFISVLASDLAAEAAVLGELTRAAGSVQHALNRKLRMRPVPRITFGIDKEEKRRERIEKLRGEGGDDS